MELLQTGELIVKKHKTKALRPSQVVNKKRTIYPFEGPFLESMGCPEKIAKIFITGPSYSGKSSFTFILCNYLTQFGTVDYNNYEEGDSQTVAEKISIHGLLEKEKLFRLLPKVPVNEMKERLLKRKSAAFAVIDSVQHAELNKHAYIQLVDTLCIPRRGKCIIFINHWVKNDLTKFIKHDCDIKIEVIGFVAKIFSRYGGNKPFIVWEQGAKKYWQKRYNAVVQGRYWPGEKK
jgi:hypothetical protein